MRTNDNVGGALCCNPLKESILSKTHYGLGIYAHILRLYYPDEVVLQLVGRDCGLCRNPFNANKKTLHIFIEKEISCKREQNSNLFGVMPSVADIARSENVLGNVYDKEFARHKDSENAIPAGDAFGFAELHYKQQGDELLQTLNKDLNLRICEQRTFYNRPLCPKSPQNSIVNVVSVENIVENKPSQSGGFGTVGGAFSFFRAPITNTKPHKAVSLLQIYNAIKGDYYKDRTQKLRAISSLPCGERQGGAARQFKASNFDYCTFSGTFTTRNDKALIKHSGLLCLDFDHLQSVEKLRFQLLQDEYFETQLLFRSPSGNGLKWIISISPQSPSSPKSPPSGDLGGWGFSHGEYFAAVANYILQTYGVAVDKSGRDISRACFLPHDSEAFINPIYLNVR